VDILIQDLQKTIEALETLSEKPATASEHIDELLDQLFQQKIDLVHAHLNVNGQPYQQAASATKKAAEKAELAVRQPAHADEAIAAITEAIAKLAILFDNLVQVG
jgi:ribosome-associated translation inhibitor RaiA